MTDQNLPLPRTEEGRARQAAWLERSRQLEAAQVVTGRLAVNRAELQGLVQARRARDSYIATIGETGIEALMMPGDISREHIGDITAMQAAYTHDLVDLEPPQGAE